ncbi:SAM-dependent methyltransferase, partial [Escherichia coli]
MTGTLYLLPNTLGPADATSGATLSHVIPEEVQAVTARLDYFIAENAKTTRAFLKIVAQAHSLARPLQ